MRRKYSTSTTTSQSCTRWVQPIDLRVPPTWTGPTPSSSRFGPVQNSPRRGETDQLCTVKVPTTPWSTTVVNLGAIRRADEMLGRTDARVRWMCSPSTSPKPTSRQRFAPHSKIVATASFPSSAPTWVHRPAHGATAGREDQGTKEGQMKCRLTVSGRPSDFLL